MNYSKIKHIVSKTLLITLLFGGVIWMSSCSDIDCPVTNGVWANYVVQGANLPDTITI